MTTAATFYGVALACSEILERGGHVATEDSQKSLHERSDENSALFHLFLTEAKSACDHAVGTIEEDKSFFMTKSNETKESM